MNIKKIVIEKEDKTKKEYLFTENVTVLNDDKDLYEIIEFLLGIHTASQGLNEVNFFATVELDDIYYLKGRKRQGELFFKAFVSKENNLAECSEEYFNAVVQKTELDSVLFFQNFKSQDYPHKLLKYLDLPKYYPDGSFAKLTNGYGTTRSFRGFVTNYIKHFKPIRLCESKELYLKLLKNGEFKVALSDSDEKVTLSQSENILYHYLSFINVADFWLRAEKIRNLNRVRKPLVVSDLAEFLDENIGFSEIIRSSNKTGRQVIFFVSNQTYL